MIGGDTLIKKRVNYMSCIEGKGGMKDIYCNTKYVALNDSLSH